MEQRAFQAIYSASTIYNASIISAECPPIESMSNLNGLPLRYYCESTSSRIKYYIP